jgi:DNA repair protein RadC
MKQSTLDLNVPDQATRIACSEQPQQRFETVGVSALSDTELIALLLNTGVHGHPVLGLAAQLLAQAGSLAEMARWQTEDFQRLKGIGRTKARQLAAVIEIGRRLMKEPANEAPVLNRPELIAAFMRPHVQGLDIEKFWVACLNRKNRLKKLVEVTRGTATSSLAHPREVFRAAIQHGATAVVCIHNHPSGDPAPSAADVQVTRQLREAAKAVDIELLDHVIVGTVTADPRGTGYSSFREAGVI